MPVNRNDTNKRGRRPRVPRSLNPDFDRDAWVPKTELGRKVKSGEITNLDDVFLYGKVMETGIIDFLIPDIKIKIVDVKKTTRMTRAGRHFAYRVSVIVGDGNGHIGIGTGKGIERMDAQTKSIQNAKLNMVYVKRGSGSWESNTDDDNSIPFMTVGKCASLRVTLLPAPKGIGLAVSDTIKPVFELVGIANVWSKTRGATDTKLNFVRATIDALNNLNTLKVLDKKEE